MIGISTVSNQKLKEVEGFINNNCSQRISLSNQEVLIMTEDEEIIGASVMSLNEGQAVLEALVVSKTRRGEYLGDGLLRASLNFILKKGFHFCLYNKNEEKGFFFKMGFVSKEDDMGNKQGEVESLAVDIESFFSKSCKSKG